MSRQTIRGSGNEIIGYQVDRPNEIVLYNEHNQIAGRYLKNMDKTYDAHGKIISQNGNILLTLLK